MGVYLRGIRSLRNDAGEKHFHWGVLEFTGIALPKFVCICSVGRRAKTCENIFTRKRSMLCLLEMGLVMFEKMFLQFFLAGYPVVTTCAGYINKT